MDRVQYPIAFCPVHGVFPAKGSIAMAHGASVTIAGVVINCPRCGRESEFIPGRYEATADHLNVLIDPSISVEALKALQALAAAVQTGKMTPAQAKKSAAQIHQRAARLFDVANWSNEAKATLYAGVIVAAATLLAARMAQPQTIVNVQPVVERAVQRSELMTTTAHTQPPLPHLRPSRKGK